MPADPAAAPGEPPPSLVRALTRLMRPLVRLLIARGITLPYLTNLLKAVYVEVAEQAFPLEGASPSLSRVSVLTGLQRRDIRKIQAAPPPDHTPPPGISLGARLIGIWTGDARFRDARGTPRPLPRTAAQDEPSFEALVRSVSSDVRPKIILEEWLRLGLTTIDADDCVVLNTDAFVPQHGFDEKAYFLGRNMADHMAASVHNMMADGAPMFERAVYYDKLTPASIAVLRERARALGTDTLLTLNKEALELADKDEGKANATQRMSLGLYYFESDDGQEKKP